MDNNRNNSKELVVDLGRVCGLVRQKWLMILLSALFCAAAAFAWSYYTGSSRYESTAMFYVDNGSDSAGISSSDISASKSLAEHCLTLLKSEDVLRSVYDNAGVDGANVTISAQILGDTAVFQVTVTAPDPWTAYQAANAVAAVLPEQAGTVFRGATVTVVDVPDAQIKVLPPDHLRITAAGFLLGSLLGLTAAVLWAVFDRTVRSESEITECCGCPVLAGVPHTDEVGNQMPAETAEAMRFLRARLDDGSRSRVIGVCDVAVDGSAAVVTANLAYLLAQPNRRVLLMECDLRDPVLGDLIPVERAPGLTNYLSGELTLEQVIQRHAFLNKHLHVITAGPVPDEPGDAFCSELFGEALDELRLEYDAVLLDLPSVGKFCDALTVSRLTDGILLTVRRNECSRDALSNAVQELEKADVKILGIIMLQ